MSRAAIVGSVALAVLSPDPRQWFPDDLNIVMPLGRSSQWSHFLLMAKFIELPTHDITSRKFSIVNAHINTLIRQFEAPETVYCDPCCAHMCTSFENGNIVVLIESAQQSILLPILSSLTTAQMNFIGLFLTKAQDFNGASVMLA
ncbi:hypothetical protein IW261DRAFT_1570299 [Armillaria novae-zelandiae]|uniref:Uncharacterized protein n=1 Tax=Armillaria novae-zelandiae TaxID=153914 RepID=A0AA39NW43_9AGAR|nr:hypothetical protein IW261DRAFT_1570299 [Armillaria novae-zelandiae]